MSGPRLKRLRYRAWHRGTRELDLILGRFADRNVEAMTPDELDIFEEFLAAADPDIHDWVLAGIAAPEGLAPMARRVRDSIGGNPAGGAA